MSISYFCAEPFQWVRIEHTICENSAGNITCCYIFPAQFSDSGFQQCGMAVLSRKNSSLECVHHLLKNVSHLTPQEQCKYVLIPYSWKDNMQVLEITQTLCSWFFTFHFLPEPCQYLAPGHLEYLFCLSLTVCLKMKANLLLAYSSMNGSEILVSLLDFLS